jgi:hypothetical protein
MGMALPVGRIQVDGGQGGRHDERHAVCPRGEREGIGTHLVGDVAVRGDAIGAGYDDVYLARGDQAGGAGVDRYPVPNTHALELPGGEA